MSTVNPTITYLCRDLIRYVFDLQGYDFLEQEVAYYKHRVSHAPTSHLPAPLPGPPSPSLIKQEEVVVVDVEPVPMVPQVVCVKVEDVNHVTHPLPSIPENRVIEIAPPSAAANTAVSTERIRYKRTELPDELRCTANTSRGTRCTLERETGKSLCSRHMTRT